MGEKVFLGVDVGSVSTDLVVCDEKDQVQQKVYRRTEGRPMESVLAGLHELDLSGCTVAGVGTTGSGRVLAAHIVGADVVKNEITAHGVAALKVCPEVRTVIEIGGQDSKIIFFEDGIITDFNMNTVCAAGTGSFLDRTAGRLGVPVEEIGSMALQSKDPVRIAGRCAVFAESDMIHKQQSGCRTEDLLNGLCAALVRGFLNNLCKGRKVEPPVLFQGGVAANEGIRQSFEKELGVTLIVPEQYEVMGALGAAILARENSEKGISTNFAGADSFNREWSIETRVCRGCPNECTLSRVKSGGRTVGEWGSECGKMTVGA